MKYSVSSILTEYLRIFIFYEKDTIPEISLMENLEKKIVLETCYDKLNFIPRNYQKEYEKWKKSIVKPFSSTVGVIQQEDQKNRDESIQLLIPFVNSFCEKCESK
jgi:TPP-dependent indolepyruvate ferredoxin oxidoreductase alpha subunit